jgi:hypothetical protein
MRSLKPYRELPFLEDYFLVCQDPYPDSGSADPFKYGSNPDQEHWLHNLKMSL